MTRKSVWTIARSGFALAGAGMSLGVAAVVPLRAAQGEAPYHLTKSVPLGPGEKWDLITFDPEAGRAYVAHGDRVTVVDTEKGETIGDVGPFPGKAQGIAIVPGGARGYTDDSKRGVAIAFDLRTLKPVKDIAARPDSDSIVYEPVTRHVFVINADSGSITVIDPASDGAVGAIDVGAGLEAGVADGRGELFVNGVEKNEIVRIDARTEKVTARWPMPDCERPHGLAIHMQTRRLFATCVNRTMVVMDADNGTTVTHLPIGGFSDGAAFDPVRKLAFSSNGDGTLSVVKENDPQHFEPLESVQTPIGARTMAIDPRSGRLFLVAAKVEKMVPAAMPGGRSTISYVPGSLQLLYFDPAS